MRRTVVCAVCGLRRPTYSKGMCRKCYHAAWVKANPELYAEKLRRQRERVRERYRSDERFRERTRARNRIYHQESYRRDPEKCRAKFIEWTKKNPEKYYRSVALSFLRGYIRRFGRDGALEAALKGEGGNKK